MRILVCLISDQHVPNLLSVHHFRPDRLVLIESDAMKKRGVAEHFKQALQCGGLEYGDDRCDIEPLASEDSLDAVRSVLRDVFNRYLSAEWIANVTGGTKPMSIATYEFFTRASGHVVYTSFSRPATLMTLETGAIEECQHQPSLKEFLAGYGFESRKSDVKIREAETRAASWATCARLIARSAAAVDLLTFPGNTDDECDRNRSVARKKGWELREGELRPPNEDVGREIASAFGLARSENGQVASGRLDQHAVAFLTGGWLEVFFWDLAVRHQNSLGIWDVRLGLEVGRGGEESGNDLDVAFMKNHRLVWIECKSGTQAHDPGSEILYKVEAVTRQYRALGASSILATTGTNILDREGRVKGNVQTRAGIYNCRIVTANQIRHLAARFESADFVRQTLFGTSPV